LVCAGATPTRCPTSGSSWCACHCLVHAQSSFLQVAGVIPSAGFSLTGSISGTLAIIEATGSCSITLLSAALPAYLHVPKFESYGLTLGYNANALSGGRYYVLRLPDVVCCAVLAGLITVSVDMCFGWLGCTGLGSWEVCTNPFRCVSSSYCTALQLERHLCRQHVLRVSIGLHSRPWVLQRRPVPRPASRIHEA
jgi:hypothetical protein